MTDRPDKVPFPQGDDSSDRQEIAAADPTPLESLGGYESIRTGVAYIAGLMQGTTPNICAVVVQGADIQPYGLPSVLLGPDTSSRDVYETAKEMVSDAIMRGESDGAIANLCHGREAATYGHQFLGRLIEVVSPELSPDQATELQQLIASPSAQA